MDKDGTQNVEELKTIITEKEEQIEKRADEEPGGEHQPESWPGTVRKGREPHAVTTVTGELEEEPGAGGS